MDAGLCGHVLLCRVYVGSVFHLRCIRSATTFSNEMTLYSGARTAIKRMPGEQPFQSPWLFDLELILRLRRYHRGTPLNVLIHEAPLNTWRDISGSKVSYSYFIWAIFDLLALWLRYRGQKTHNTRLRGSH